MPTGIIIVGLGPGHPDHLTIEAHRVLSSASEVYTRTSRHPTLTNLNLPTKIVSFDEVYERAATFADVYSEIAERIVELGSRPQGVVFAVPGHPLAGEESTRQILELASEKSLTVRVVEGISFIDSVCALLGVDPLAGLQVGDATELALRHHSQFSPDLPLLVGQLYDRSLASDVKLLLMAVYPDDHRVSLVRAAGTVEAKVTHVPLYALDRDEMVDHLTSLYVPPLSEPGSVASFQELVAHLRAPDGCPWDREQTHSTLRPYLLEETYEVLQALDGENADALADELGDLLLQILLHSQIATEDGEFRMRDVVAHSINKLTHRHPHVFGNVEVSSAGDVLVNWEQIKRDERASQPRGAGLDRISLAMPALLRAQALQERAARAGFEWQGIDQVVCMVEEHWDQLMRAPEEERSHELGDLLFALVNLARWFKVDAESALREAMVRFEARFTQMERVCTARDKVLRDLTPDEWRDLWVQCR